jgi:putative phage-type endonuclease
MSTGLSTSRDDWLRERRNGIGASDAPIVCGIAGHKSRLHLWLEKRGELDDDDEPTEAMRWGLALEPVIAAAYTGRTGREITKMQVNVKHSIPWIRATLDGIDDEGGIVEFKACGNWASRSLPEEDEPDGLPDAWQIQAQHQMLAAGPQHTWVTFAVFADLSLKLYHVNRHEDLIGDMLELESVFWDSVCSGEPPGEFTADDAQVITRHFNREDDEHRIIPIDDLGSTLFDYQYAQKQLKQHEELRDRSKASILFAMGNAATAECGSYRLKRKIVQVKERTQFIKASQYVRFTCKNGDQES